MGALISSARAFDLFGVWNSRAGTAHTGLHTEPRQYPAVEGDPKHEESNDQQDIFHGCYSLVKHSAIVRDLLQTGPAQFITGRPAANQSPEKWGSVQKIKLNGDLPFRPRSGTP